MSNITENNMHDILDVRSLIERYEELETELLDCFNEQQENEGFTVSDDSEEIYQATDGEDALFTHWLSDCRLEEALELHSLKAILEDLKGNGGDEQWRGDWYPITLIRDSYFTEYAQELAEECGMVDPKASWPTRCIDWEQAADELKTDYTSTEIDGVTYWYR